MPICYYDDGEQWIKYPDQWLGKHIQTRDQAIEASAHLKSANLTRVSIAMALLEDWRLDGLNGNPGAWNFAETDGRLLMWVALTVMSDLEKCFLVPKASSSPLPEATKTGEG